jgi:ankyrin repeat protein
MKGHVHEQSPNCRTGRVLLHEAVWAGNADAVQQLLSSGSDINAKDFQGWTPLHLAAVRGFPSITLLLLQHGAVSAPVDNTGRTPLHFTARSGDLVSARHLLDFGAPLAAQDSSRRSILHDAANRGSDALLALLLQRAEHPAAVGLQADRNGMVPLQCAAHRGHEAAVRVLLPAVLQAPAPVATATISAAAAAAVSSSYLQVACLLLKELGRKGPGSVSGVVAELCGGGNGAGVDAVAAGGIDDDGAGSGGALVSALVMQWVADCANMPQQQQQLQRDQDKLDSEHQRMQGLCLAVANLMCELHDPEG